MVTLFKIITFFLFVYLSVTAYALEPNEVMVMANKNAARSKGLAEYYMKQRGIPDKNLLLVWLTDKETCSREDYVKKVVIPVRKFLSERTADNNIKCIVTMFGMPLKIASPDISENEKKSLAALNHQKQELQIKSKAPESLDKDKVKELKDALSKVNGKIKQLKLKLNRGASLDSELTLVKKDTYNLDFWIPNPYFLGFMNQNVSIEKSDVIMTCRIDGPSSEIVERIIDDSIKAEKEGLRGIAYFDARWPPPDKKNVSGYAFYDKSIHLAADNIKKNNIIPLVEESTNKLFGPGECPDAALYCGWYRLANYVDSFTWQPGSIGYHIASSECTTLKGKNSNVWCKRMLEKGVAATIGPVGEPYVRAFPVPEIFFHFLTEGKLSLAECYFVSLPYLSWKMVLVGDPLYRPFRNKESIIGDGSNFGHPI